MIIDFKKLYADTILPYKGSKDAACHDLVAHSVEFDHVNETVEVSLGFATEIPVGYKACISPRSSLTKLPFVIPNSPGQIDADYRGEWMVKFRYVGSDTYNQNTLNDLFPYEEGDRVAQMWIEKVEEFTINEVSILSDSDRGKGGFGSTGR